MLPYVFEPPARRGVPVASGGVFPVRRIYCIGKNYAAHVTEMGGDAARSEPIFFAKDATTLVRSGENVPYPPNTQDLHHEVELVVAIGPPDIDGGVFGHAVGLDLTRRDLQAVAKSQGQPWDRAKNFAASAPCGPIRTDWRADGATISLSVNGETRQSAPLSDMIWSVDEIIARLRADMDLGPGDMIYTGTPAGVGPIYSRDHLVAEITGLPSLNVVIA